MRELNHEANTWVGMVKYHLSQIGKGVLVSGVAIGSYNLWKRWWVNTPSETMSTHLREDEGAVSAQSSVIVSKSSEKTVVADLFSAKELNQKKQEHALHPEHELDPSISNLKNHDMQESLAKGLNISFHPKSAPQKDMAPQQTPVTTHTLDPENADPENVTIIVGEEFQIKIPGYKVEADGKTYYFGTMSATLADGSPLPAWVRLESPSIPLTPNIFSTTKTGLGAGIAVRGDLAMVAGWSTGFQLVNISDPMHPMILSTQTMPAYGYARGVAVQGDLALVAADTSGLQLINISDSRNLKIVSSMAIPGIARRITVQGNLALVAAATNGLQLVNISNPMHPTIIGNQSMPDDAWGVAVQGNLTLVAAGSSGLQLVNISNPKQPTIIGNKTLPGYAFNVVMQGDLALVAVDTDGLQIINVSDPKHPTIISSLVMPGNAFSISVEGNLALVATLSEGLQVVNITSPTVPRIVAQIKTKSDAFSVVAKSNLGLVGCRNGLKIIDFQYWSWTLIGIPPINERGITMTLLLKSHTIADVRYQKTLRLYSSSRPYLRNSIPDLNVKPEKELTYQFVSDFFDASDGILPYQGLEFSREPGHRPLPSWLSVDFTPIIGYQAIQPGGVSSVAVLRNIAVVAARSEGLQLINVSNPRDPLRIGRQPLPGDASSVVVLENLALVAADTSGLQLVNISDPKRPVIISSQAIPGNALDVSVQEDLAVVAALSGGLQFINISDPKHPMIMGSQALPGNARSISIKKNVVLVAADTSGLQLVNISNPKHPFIIGSQAIPGSAYGVAMQGDLALVAASSNILWLINISDPKQPTIISSQIIPGSSWNVAVQDHLALVPASNTGLQLVNISHPQHPTIIGGIETFGVAHHVIIQDNMVFLGTSIGLNIIQFGLTAGILSGQPSKADHGNYFISITTRNSDGIAGNATFRVSVNNPPLWINPIANRTVNVGQVVSFQLPINVFWDEDGDELTFNSTLANGTILPEWITFFALPRYQVYTVTPSTSNRGQYNIMVSVDDGYYGRAHALFSLIVPTRKPVKISDIPSQNAFIQRPYELFVSSIFMSPDGDSLFYRAQLKGAQPLPKWLHFDNTTCITSCHFFGNPSITDLSDLEVELIATGLGGEANAEFSIIMRTSTLFQDLATYYSVSGAGLVVLSLLARFRRWQKMLEIHGTLTHVDGLEKNQGLFIQADQVTRQNVESMLQNLLLTVERKQTLTLAQNVQAYSQSALTYAKQNHCMVTEIVDLWKVIKDIITEINIRMIRRLNYQDTYIWVEVLHRLLQIIIETEFNHGRAILKADKEQLFAVLSKAEKYIEPKEKFGVQIKHQLQLCREVLVSMDDTDSIKDNLCCRDSEMLLEIIKTMVAPPYGIMRLMYQQGNIPGGWYPIIIKMCHLAEQALTNSGKLYELQIQLSQQKDWRVIYEGVGLLGKVVRETQDEKIQKQAIEGIPGKTRGLNYYQNYIGFWGRCSPCCDKESAWIRVHAQQELSDLDHEDRAEEVNVNMHSLNSLSQPLLTISS